MRVRSIVSWLLVSAASAASATLAVVHLSPPILSLRNSEVPSTSKSLIPEFRVHAITPGEISAIKVDGLYAVPLK